MPSAARTIGLVALVACACRAPEADPGVGDGRCELAFTDTGSVRVFVVGHAFVPDDALTYDSFARSYREHMAEVGDCLSTARENLVLFPEDAGLIAWFIGRRAMLARHAGDSATAFNAAYAGYFRKADDYLSRFEGISEARALTLALGDTAWRAMDRTFGGIARDWGVWVVTSANVPEVVHTTDPDEVARWGDPDVDPDEGAYVATRPDVFNMAILYGPGGERLGATHKVFLTDVEEDTLDISNGSLERLGVFELPFARVGPAISRDAFYAPFMQRLEDLDVEFVVQPEAFSGWMVPQQEGDWLPDVITSSGWSHTQKYRGFRHSAAPMLVGNLYELFFDGQTWITLKSAPDQTPRGFLGTPPTRGWVDIGPWVMEEPQAATLEERRVILRSRGDALAPGSEAPEENGYRDSLIAADLAFFGDGAAPPIPVTPQGPPTREVAPSATGHQTNPDAAYGGSRLHAVWSDARGGAPRVFHAFSDDDGATWSAAAPVTSPGSARQLRPSVAASASGHVIVAWQEEIDGAPAQIRVAASDDGGFSFAAATAPDSEASAQWEPDVALSRDGAMAILVWSDFRDGPAPRIRWSSSLDGAATWSPSMLVDAGQSALPRMQGTQLQPTVAFAPDRAVVAWVDYRERDWEVWGSTLDANAFTPAERISPDDPSEILASDPQLAESPDGVWLSWDDLRGRRGHHDVRAARRDATGVWRAISPPPGGAESGVYSSRFRPSVGASGNDAVLVFQDLSPGKNALLAARAAAGSGAIAAPVRVDDTGDAANQLTRPRVASRGTTAVAVFEDDRSGWSRVYVTAPLAP